LVGTEVTTPNAKKGKDTERRSFIFGLDEVALRQTTGW